MGKVKRLCLVVVSVAGATSIAFFAVLWFDVGPLLPAAFWLAGQSWFGITLPIALGITAAGLLAALVYAIAAPGAQSHLTDTRERGTVVVDKKALESTARRTIKRHRGLEAKSVKVKISGTGPATRIRIKTKVGNDGSSNLALLGSRLQNEIIAAVETLTGHAVKSVRIHFIEGAAQISGTALPSDATSIRNSAAPAHNTPIPVNARTIQRPLETYGAH